MSSWCDKSLRKPLLSNINKNKSKRREKNRESNIINAGIELRRKSKSSLSNNNINSSEDNSSADESDSDYSKNHNLISSNSKFKMGVGGRIGLLTWKNWIFRKRHYVLTALEIVLPTLFALLIAYMRSFFPTELANEFKFDSSANTTYPLVSQTAMMTHAGNVFSCSKSTCVIAFSPKNDLTTNIMNNVKGIIPKGNFGLEGFQSEDEIELYMAQVDLNSSSISVKAAIIFDSGVNTISPFPPSHIISYKIRLVNKLELESTKDLFPLFQLPGPSPSNVVNYVNSGLIGLQIAIDRVLIQVLSGTQPLQDINLQAFPYPPYEGGFDFSQIYFVILPQFMVLGFIFIVPSLIKSIISEKETGIKELMKMMGLPNWMHWVGWMINSLMVLSLSITIVIFLFFYKFDSKAGAVISYSSPTLWWSLLILYAMAATSFCFFISAFFTRPTLGTTVGIVLWLVSYYVPVQIMEPKYRFLSFGVKMISALLPNVALHWLIKVLCGFEGKSVGAHWSNIADPVSSVDDLSVLSLAFMLILDIFIYCSLTIYFENVIPTEYGVTKQWYYIFKPSTWCLKSGDKKVGSGEFDVNESKLDETLGFEPELPNLRVGVELRGLTKRFGRNKVAADRICLKMYDGQITALLGHNGAGKTTTMSMLTGLFAPSSGTATVNGFDIITDMDKVRLNMGLCPQHNMLFDKLTVEEHLIFFGRLKGLSTSGAIAEMKNLLDKLQLREKRTVPAAALSGGQKRKLALGMALIGGTKIVILDEPTSGMDPEARRAIWDLLLEMRGERTIILTTHFMEEADILGDRIAIMGDGRVKCCGSPMFLKKYYGAGYSLKMTLESENSAPLLLSLIQSHIPKAASKKGGGGSKRVSNELWVTIPVDGTTNAAFPSLFSALSDIKKESGIKTISLSLTTMDEVFVKVGEDADLLKDERKDSNTSSNTSSAANKERHQLYSKKQNGMKLGLQRFRALLAKRAIYTLRKRNLFISQFFIPVLLLIGTILLSNANFHPSPTQPSLQMDLRTYKNPVTLCSADGVDKLCEKYLDVVSPSGRLLQNSKLEEELLRIGASDLGAYRERYIVGAEFGSQSGTGLFSSIPYHSSPLAINLVSNALLKGLDERGYGIRMGIHPLESGLYSLLEPAEPNPVFSTVVPILFGVLLPIALALFSASFIVCPVEEKICKSKQLQLMTGVSPAIFWGSSFLWDFTLMGLLVVVMVICFPIFQSFGAFTAYSGGGVIFLILITYGFSAITFSYIFSLFVKTVPSGFSLVTITHILTGMIMSLITYFMETNGLGDKISTLRIIGRLFPTFGASVSIMKFTAIATTNSRCNILTEATKSLICNPAFSVKPELRQCCSNCADFENPDGESCFKPQPYLTWERSMKSEFSALIGSKGSNVPGIGQDLTYLFLIGFAYIFILLAVEYGIFSGIVNKMFRARSELFKNRGEDDDVRRESQRVRDLVSTGKVDDEALVVDSLCKSYGSFAAVSNLSFAVHRGECFGLLGVNGAGKTTSFRMLTGDEIRSNGNAHAEGFSLERNRKSFLGNIGFCPQFDGIVNVLTGKEMLLLFGRLRGIREESVETEAEKWLSKLGLYESRDVECGKYSGGMKRRLSAAMALIGDPPIILLDEPTTGVDPIARRQFWKVLSGVRSNGQAVVLTSHSMEECEALCSRLGIMVNGQFECLGGVEHLKTKFAQGYSLTIKLRSGVELSSPEVIELSTEIQRTLSPCTLKDEHQNLIKYGIGESGRSLGDIFRLMENFKGRYGEVVEDYAVSETTLEEVFLSFARRQKGERSADIGFLRKLLTCQCCDA